jgi:hypothetical protein
MRLPVAKSRNPIDSVTVTDKPRNLGPAGGRTTVTPGGLVKKTLYIPSELEEALRAIAFHRRVSLSALVRKALESYAEEHKAEQ